MHEILYNMLETAMLIGNELKRRFPDTVGRIFQDGTIRIVFKSRKDIESNKIIEFVFPPRRIVYELHDCQPTNDGRYTGMFICIRNEGIC